MEDLDDELFNCIETHVITVNRVPLRAALLCRLSDQVEFRMIAENSARSELINRYGHTASERMLNEMAQALETDLKLPKVDAIVQSAKENMRHKIERDKSAILKCENSPHDDNLAYEYRDQGVNYSKLQRAMSEAKEANNSTESAIQDALSDHAEFVLAGRFVNHPDELKSLLGQAATKAATAFKKIMDGTPQSVRITEGDLANVCRAYNLKADSKPLVSQRSE